MNTGKQQQEQLPVTSSSEITESKGLDAYMWFVILIGFALLNKVFDSMGMQNGTPMAFIVCGLIWFGFKMYLKDKPPKFLQHLFQYFALPKRYTHFCKDKPDALKD
jgi:hypothetical protein